MGTDLGALADSACRGAAPTSKTVQIQAPLLSGLQTDGLNSVDCTASTLAALKGAGVHTLAHGNFITVAIHSTILAFTISMIFMMVKQVSRLKREAPPAPPAAAPEDVVLLRGIGNSLRK